MSEFIFAAGPNGAGKSTLAQYLAPDNAVIINGDKIREESKNLQQAERKTKNLIEGALILNRPIYYESNFLDPRDREFYLSFRQHGYSLQLIFMGLNTIEDSVQRVSQRVQSGGHLVPITSIELNFKHGLRNAISNYNDFDTVMLVDNPLGKDRKTEIVFASENGKEIFRTNTLPVWADTLLHHVNNPNLPLPFADEIDEHRGRKR
ncbi:zeta toxin family protein [Olivibacter sitiensis]|uniref:zeta toxin family protein n=1 Tax=Olivibacter sitiensis TaxID=376470 RepID=UPI00040AD0BF|nr:zeta toxin family protein [Olivibacter sitiensis]